MKKEVRNMAGYSLGQIRTYTDFKKAFDREISRQTEGFVRMGYLLKVARDTNILHESGYQSVAEFAAAEYKLSADTVSRMVAINDRYSKGGYSEELDEKYQSWGTTLLAEMLVLPDAVIDALPEGTTREDVRGLKKEYKEEQKVTPIEVALEPPAGGWEVKNTLEEFVKAYWTKEWELYEKLWYVLEPLARERFSRTLESMLAPSGQLLLTARIPQKGKYMLSMKRKGGEIALVNMRSAARETYTWDEFVRVMDDAAQTGVAKGPEDAWQWMTGEKWPGQKRRQDAPEQGKQAKDGQSKSGQSKSGQKRGEAQNGKRKEKEEPDRGGKVYEDRTRRPRVAGTEAQEQVAAKAEGDHEGLGITAGQAVEAVEAEEIAPAQIEYQTDIEHDFPEVLPEGYEPPEQDLRWELEKTRLKYVERLLGRADLKIKDAITAETPPETRALANMAADLNDCIAVINRVVMERE